jgi:tRNA (guanine37-N1)-methyltransferase
MRFDIITIFPRIFDSYFNESILERAQKEGLIKIGVHDLRQWTTDKHKTVDDSPYGGGPGMVFKVEPLWKAVKDIKSQSRYCLSGVPNSGTESKACRKTLRRGASRLAQGIKSRVILFSAKGKQFTQADARRLAKYDQLILICGRYEGVDERVAEHIADEELSVGNFVLTGGEIPAMIVVDAVSRLVPGVLGKKESLEEESFSKRLPTTVYRLPPKKNSSAVDRSRSTVDNYLEYPQYTRPESFRGWKVPEVLLSGNHKKIEEWRSKKSLIESRILR